MKANPEDLNVFLTVAHAAGFREGARVSGTSPSRLSEAVRRLEARLGVRLFEDRLRPHFDSGSLESVLEPWWQTFSGPFLYYPGHRLVPAPLRVFVDFIKAPDNHFATAATAIRQDRS